MLEKTFMRKVVDATFSTLKKMTSNGTTDRSRFVCLERGNVDELV